LTINGGSSSSTTYSGIIADKGTVSGSTDTGPLGSLNIAAGGVLTLSGYSSTYGGGTTVTGGTLLVTSTVTPNVTQSNSSGTYYEAESSTGLGGVTVTGGTLNSVAVSGRLGGIGIIGNGSVLATSAAPAAYTGTGGPVLITTGGTISPGTSTLADSTSTGVGTLTTGDMTWNGGKYVFKTNVPTGRALDAADIQSAYPGTQDLLVVNGILNITGSSPFTILVAANGQTTPNSAAVYTIVYASEVVANGTTYTSSSLSGPVTLAAADFSVSDDTTSNSYNVEVAPDANGGVDLEVVAGTVTPEPGSLGLLGVACLGLLRRRRRTGTSN
jgi:autotransporter-associated beta strand protein